MSEKRTPIETEAAPAAIGPYSQGIAFGGLLFCSGQAALDPKSGELVGETVAEQATRCLRSLQGVCEAAGTGLDRALRLTIYTTRLDLFAEINDAYAAFFSDDPPARATVGVDALPMGALVEIDAIVAVG